MNIASAKLWLPSALGAVGSAIFVALHLDRPWIVAGEPTPILVPCLVSLVLLAACLIDTGIMVTKAATAVRSQGRPKPDHVRLAWYLVSLLAFALLLKYLGFIPLVAIIFPLLLVFGERVPFRKAMLITVATGLVVYIVFERLLAVDLPHGALLSAWL
jgi:hypothetical protein